MEAHIIKKLMEIEASKGIRILFACESGSRGWGFPSIDSDYDVRFFYMRKAEDQQLLGLSTNIILNFSRINFIAN